MEALIQMPQTLVGLTFAGISVVKPPVVHDKLIEDFLRSIDEFRGDGKSKEEKQQLGDAGEDAVLKNLLYRLCEFPKSPKLYILSGSLLSGSELAPRYYWGWPKSKNA